MVLTGLAFFLTNLLTTAAIAAQSGTVPAPQLPQDGWTVDVRTSGGLTGAGKGSVSVQWDGALACTPPITGCAARAPRESTARVSTLVTGLMSIASPAITSKACSDCFVTTMTVKRRMADGGEILRTYTWNDAEFAGVPESLKRLHAEVVALSQRR